MLSNLNAVILKGSERMKLIRIHESKWIWVHEENAFYYYQIIENVIENDSNKKRKKKRK